MYIVVGVVTVWPLRMRRESNRRPIDPAEIMAANREDVPDSSSALALMSFLSDPATLVSLGVIAGGTAYYLLTRPPPVKPPIPLDNQSLELPVSNLRMWGLAALI